MSTNSRRASRSTASRCARQMRRAQTSRLESTAGPAPVPESVCRTARRSTSIDAAAQLLEARPEAVDHRVGDAMEQADRPLGHPLRVVARIVAPARRSPSIRSNEPSRETSGPTKQSTSSVVGRRSPANEIAVVGFDLRGSGPPTSRPRPPDDETQNVSLRRSDSGIDGASRSTQTKRAGGRTEPGAIDSRHLLGPPVAVHEDGVQSPTLTDSAACAAASRATGTR